jgi:threonine/homoserine/homoserine lactone efflux protein
MEQQFLGFAAVAAAFMLLPGADFTIVVRNALDGRSSGIAAASGVGLGLVVRHPEL